MCVSAQNPSGQAGQEDCCKPQDTYTALPEPLVSYGPLLAVQLLCIRSSRLPLGLQPHLAHCHCAPHVFLHKRRLVKLMHCQSKILPQFWHHEVIAVLVAYDVDKQEHPAMYL